MRHNPGTLNSSTNKRTRTERKLRLMSYLEHFKFTQPPFGLTPDPEFVYWSKQHARAKAFMESTIWLSDGFVVITGEIGSGKTTLLQSFLSELDDNVVYAVVSQTQLSPTQFLQAVLTEFGFKPFKKKKVELLDMLNMFLIEQYSTGKKVILIIDEAQNLSAKVLEEVRLLSGIETQKEKVMRIIFAGQPELKETLASPELKQLVQRVRLKFHLGPLDRRDTRAYVEHRLAVAGRPDGDLFDEECFETIYRYSGGVPRLINTLCDSALLVAFADEKTSIQSSDIDATAEELGWVEHEDTTGEHEVIPHLVEEKPEKKNSLVRVELRADGEPVEEFFFDTGKFVIGRAPDNDIFIDSQFVSRHHAQLAVSEAGCAVEDLNSTNGVFIGDDRVTKQILEDGDVISLGTHELIFSDLREPIDSSDTAVNGKQG